MENILFLFNKKVKNKEGGEFDKFFATTVDNTHSISVNLTETAKAQILTSSITSPWKITIVDDDYFIANEKYEDANGITLYANKLVIQNFTKIEKADIKKKTLQDVWAE